MADGPTLDIDYVAQLARIALTPAERELFSRQLGDVLSYIRKLEEVDVTGVQPTAHAFPVKNVWREDVAEPGLPPEALVKMAPLARSEMVVVPKVVEDAG